MKKDRLVSKIEDGKHSLKYNLDVDDAVDTRVYDMSTTGKLPHMFPCHMEEDGGARVFTYRIGDKIPVQEFLKKEVNKPQMLTLLYNILSGLEDFGLNMVSLSYVAKDVQYIYVEPENQEVSFVVAPVSKETTDLNEVRQMLKDVIAGARYFEMDRDNYVAKLISALNRPGTFSLGDTKKYVEQMLKEIGIDIASINKNKQEQIKAAEKANADAGKVSRLGVMMNNARMNDNGQAPMPGFGQFGQPAQPPQNQNGMGQPGFGQAPMPGFGQFGQPAQPPQNQNGMGQPGFGQAPMPGFGQFGQPAQSPQNQNGMGQPGFGQAPMPGFGQFGQPAQAPQNQNGMGQLGFGQAPMPAFGQFGQPAPMPEMPQAPEAPHVPDMPPVPEAPHVPDMPQAPEAPEMPPVPEAPHVPEMPQAPDVPDMPPVPEVPHIPEAPHMPDMPELDDEDQRTISAEDLEDLINIPTPEAPQAPEAPHVPEMPQVPPVPEVPQIQPAQGNGFPQFGGFAPVPPMAEMPQVTEMPQEPQMPHAEGLPKRPKLGEVTMTGIEIPEISEASNLVESSVILDKPTPYLIRKKTGEKILINKDEFIIGKSANHADYTVRDNTAVSRAHCIISRRNGVCYIRDNNSTNGTFINEQELDRGGERFLTNNVTVKLGDEEFVFYIG